MFENAYTLFFVQLEKLQKSYNLNTKKLQKLGFIYGIFTSFHIVFS